MFPSDTLRIQSECTMISLVLHMSKLDVLVSNIGFAHGLKIQRYIEGKSYSTIKPDRIKKLNDMISTLNGYPVKLSTYFDLHTYGIQSRY